MAQCVHLHDAGVQCVSEALPGEDFCEDHVLDGSGFAVVGAQGASNPLRKLLLRLVALLLLLMLLVPFYRVARSLYLSESFQAGEGR